MSPRFRISWVIRDQLALGPAPSHIRHVEALWSQGVKAVLSLCAVDHHVNLPDLEQGFARARVVLPDHRDGRAPQPGELLEALHELELLCTHGPVFVHCVASIERSPLLCMAWLMRHRKLTRLQALDYLVQIHPYTNPLSSQLIALDQLFDTEKI